MSMARGSGPLQVLAVAAAFVIIGCATPDRPTPGVSADDRGLVRNVESALNADRYLDTDHVTVRVSRGVVRLSGQVADDEDLRSVLRICWAVPGVRGVDDQLEIIDFGQDGGGENPTH
jgi:hypothetical protein